MAVAGDSLMRALSSGQGIAGRLLNDPTLYDRLNKLTTDLNAMLEDVKKDPHKYFKGVVCVIAASDALGVARTLRGVRANRAGRSSAADSIWGPFPARARLGF
jgi:hypothetical protein